MAFKNMAARLSMIAGAAVLSAVSAFAQPIVGDAEVGVSQVKVSVIAVDADTRQVVLKGPEGNIFTVKAGPAIKKFDEIKVGDTVTITETDAVIVDIAKPEAGVGVGIQVSQAVATDPNSPKPAGAVVDTIRLTAEIVRLDPDDATVTLKGPEGRLYLVQAKKPEHKEKVKGLKVGDLVQVTFNQSVAIAVTK
ncbi:hypothetical protein [Xanthobacter agilis]|uniref:Uncharacterized protein n=1 Tax=Xanthobacter agilis TaxID=47492 RepID=A0ABU0LH48_XANAG|nr:hypothetical protein [Xanthobacter agilis]MDQ0506472.1 hypothetical protein [Xanthobacter agilis]